MNRFRPAQFRASTESVRQQRIGLKRILRSESFDFYFLLGVTVFMVPFGLMMVLSASGVESHNTSNDFFARFSSQSIFAVIGLAGMLLVSRLPARFFERTAWLILVGACALQLLAITTPLGVKVGDNTNWLRLGSLTGQPSEAIKIALVIWLGVVLARRGDELGDWRRLVLHVVPAAAASIVLVLLGGDLGTTVIMAAFVLGALFFAGVRLKHLSVAVLAIAVVAVLVACSSASRLGRVSAFFGGSSAVNPDINWQLDHGDYALADGGLLGVGLGNSREKWSWLPSADTDFIFAIIGEELGLIGAGLVLVLFGLLAWVMLRIINRSSDIRSRATTAAVLVWIVGQAFVNVGVVLGLIPVLGVPLPFISAGGTALVSSMMAIGLVLSVSRRSYRRGPNGDARVGPSSHDLRLVTVRAR